MTGPNLNATATSITSFDVSIPLTYTTRQNPAFTDALYLESFENLTTTAGFKIQNVYTAEDNGYKQKGVAIDEQRYGLEMVTKNPKDSMIIPAQNAITKGERVILKFPVTSGDVWNSDFTWTVSGTVTISPTFNNTPISKIGNISQHDSIIGWGKAQIPTGDGKLSAFYDVLVEQRTYIQVDSFYLDGKPVEPLYAGLLGIAQGKATKENSRKFWRNSMIDMATVNYGTDSTFTTPQSTSFDGSVPAGPTSVDENAILSNSIAYPNPTENEVTISYSQTNESMTTVEFFNLLGTVVKSVPVFSQAETVNVPISLSELSSGMYRYSVRNQNGVVIGQGNVTITQ
ncbi:MAG: T9SS type A sorting domain-containing protein [Ignavibacteriae bacterium]|nr:T9SS type A sorting domain-containing protein [Ignavibacteriota bacterium]